MIDEYIPAGLPKGAKAHFVQELKQHKELRSICDNAGGVYLDMILDYARIVEFLEARMKAACEAEMNAQDTLERAAEALRIAEAAQAEADEQQAAALSKRARHHLESAKATLS